MKVQDIAFLIVLVFLIFKHNPKLSTVAGLVCLVLSIPLFATWTFFTAERLTWYAAAFFLLAIIFSLWVKKGKSVKIKE
ncbi:MAG: hypothetical protein A3B41_04355 [Candidatus Levybacteria bacterium RIFCSPLOWO2_01_FULL_37_26]|nr:MAG: hypothetical protein A3B41_04355 [Candidatus Levybacteria bacterium RIFCSPLOWO2_01_FULL_37_26]